MRRIRIEPIGDPLGEMIALIWVDDIPYGFADDEEGVRAVLATLPPREPRLRVAPPKTPGDWSAQDFWRKW
jgi:hypothetical protein